MAERNVQACRPKDCLVALRAAQHARGREADAAGGALRAGRTEAGADGVLHQRRRASTQGLH
eukprot:8613226-Pyramimonas_sp.AAC.1